MSAGAGLRSIADVDALPAAVQAAVREAFRVGTRDAFVSRVPWAALAAVLALFLTNILWFTAISRVGPSRASLFSNLQPVFGVAFALVLLGESLGRWKLVGGALILGAVLAERFRRVPPQPPGD